MNHYGRAVLLVACGLSCAAATAQSPDAGGASARKTLSMSAGVMVTDNIGRTDDSVAKSQTELELGLFADMRVERERMGATLAADLQYQTGRYDAVGDDLSGGLNAQAEYRILADRLVWTVDDAFAQALVNSVSVATPQNTQNINVIATGPRLILPLGTRTSIAFDGKWTNVWYGQSDYGNNRLTGGASLLRQLGAGSQLSFNGQVESIKYSELPPDADYDVKSAYLGWSAKGRRTTLDLDAGYTQLSENTGKTGGALMSLSLIRRLTARTQMKLDAGRNFGNSADNMRRDQDIRGVSVNARPGAVSSDPMRSDVASAAWLFDGPRSSASVRADWRRENHTKQTEFNKTENRGELQVGRVLGPRLTLDLRGGYSRSRFNLADIRFTEWDFGAGLSWKATQAFGVGLRLRHMVGSGDTSEGPGTRDYTENRGELHLLYTPRF